MKKILIVLFILFLFLSCSESDTEGYSGEFCFYSPNNKVKAYGRFEDGFKVDKWVGNYNCDTISSVNWDKIILGSYEINVPKNWSVNRNNDELEMIGAALNDKVQFNVNIVSEDNIALYWEGTKSSIVANFKNYKESKSWLTNTIDTVDFKYYTFSNQGTRYDCLSAAKMIEDNKIIGMYYTVANMTCTQVHTDLFVDFILGLKYKGDFIYRRGEIDKLYDFDPSPR